MGGCGWGGYGEYTELRTERYLVCSWISSEGSNDAYATKKKLDSLRHMGDYMLDGLCSRHLETVDGGAERRRSWWSRRWACKVHA